MFFNSFDFLLFFVVVFALQLALPHRPRNAFLLLASYFFYGCWDWRFLGLILLSTVVDYVCSHGIAKSRDSTRRKQLLAFSIVVNLSILGFFKYFNFFADTFNAIATSSGLAFSSWTLNIVLPVGISFFTFQTMSYTIDVYRRDLKPLTSFIDFALYVAFFPQLVAGPIERGTRLAPQIKEGRRTTWTGVQDGSWLVVKGLFKKTVIADNMAPIVDQVFNNPSATGPEVLLAVYAFAFQIYGDFSGYTDIARGIGRMLGYDLMLNFRLPYLATSPSDFWGRWHISLSTWLRDYVYIPLGGNRIGSFNTIRNLMLTMVLGGLWHGAAWTFVLWGVFHGALLILFRTFVSGPEPKFATAHWWIRVAIMFHLTCLGWMIFRVESLGQLAHLFAAMDTWIVTEQSAHICWMLTLLCLPLILVHLLEEKSKDLDFIRGLSLFPRTITYSTAMASILLLGSFGGREFIYFQF
ncbi:membrane bound O-acyl transferase MBOAT family protein [Rhodopirellula maiorica SM1]|uniref:Membrane bound O-acyl transferase MBOAT family protein n=1 Tax=Rhodopirellula maiorica SM1 TaxID=1265738 RepID=M5RVB4_9BACT|nr:MBOAT family O-acyltransferase [Rhodopirellula maiorica]EMI17894.1 membrane bound O-acyl transferase MBOAT family protein [Rhodopirellula maiorica SM1]